ncbi:MAG: hypothetical protein QNJ41_29110 [Xenococcaceae cyanobacterium MO_188.B32]|nr:hypothetical protein [Xenococcaceae cyanobacterium MO_188.B32]
MSIKYKDQIFLGFQEYIDCNERGGVSGVCSTPLYAHPVDEWIIRTLNSTAVTAVINKAIDALGSVCENQSRITQIFLTSEKMGEP